MLTEKKNRFIEYYVEKYENKAMDKVVLSINLFEKKIVFYTNFETNTQPLCNNRQLFIETM